MPVPTPIVIVGGGRMGEAIVAGLTSGGVAAPGDVVVVEPADERRTVLSGTYGVATAAEGAEAVAGAAVLVLAVKPQVIDDVVAGLAGALAGRAAPPSVVSIAAGVPCGRLEALLPPGTPVVRVMPNAPAMVGEAMSAVSAGAEAGGDDLGLAVEMFSALGRVVVVDEALQDAVTAVSGSGPAYVALFVDALARAGEEQGLPRGTAETLALQTVAGTAALLSEPGQEPLALVEAVSSPGGTTVAALAALDEAGFREAVAAAVAAATARSKELGS